jgi:hypothetical protein
MHSLHPGDRAMLVQYICACRSRPGELVVGALRLTGCQGLPRHTEWKMSLLPSKDGGEDLIYAVGVDKVDHYLSGQSMGTLQFLVKLCFDTSPAIQFSIGEENKILFYNRRAMDFIQAGTGVLPAIGQPLGPELLGRFARCITPRIQEARKGSIARFEEKYLHADGREEWFRIELVPCSFGGETGVSCSLLDVSALRSSVSALRNSAFAISHQVRSHLSNVDGISRLMEELMESVDEGALEEAQLPELVKMIREETLNLNRAVQRVERHLFSDEQR